MEKQIPSTPNPEKSRGVYGFVLCMGFVLLIIIYFLWLLIPTSVTKTWTYEPPQKYWAVAVPIFFCTILFLFAFCIYPAMHSRHDGDLHELSAIQDKYSISNPSKSFCEIPLFDEQFERKFIQAEKQQQQEQQQQQQDQEQMEEVQTRNRSKGNNKKKKQNTNTNYPSTSIPQKDNINTKPEKIENLKLYDDSNLNVQHFSERPIPSATDLDLNEVCKVLYLKR